jgi:hypothetical protein
MSDDIDQVAERLKQNTNGWSRGLAEKMRAIPSALLKVSLRPLPTLPHCAHSEYLLTQDWFELTRHASSDSFKTYCDRELALAAKFP